MNTLEGRAWYAISKARGVGSKSLWLIADYLAGQGKTASWLLADPDKIKIILHKGFADIAAADFFKTESMANERRGLRPETVLHPLHAEFPDRLRLLKDRIALPALLYTQGNTALLKRPAIAIVGKRNAKAAAIHAAESLAGELASQGIHINSGHAAGIDSAAHLAALRAGGTTGLILAEGIRRFNPRAELKDYWTPETGLVISQFEPDAPWAAYMAMTRNKLIGALSDALVVIVSGPERDTGGRNSGTFNAALAALKMAIPVFVATPGSFAEDMQGNRDLMEKGCLEWDPATGAALIQVAARTYAKKMEKPSQSRLFEKVKS
jgi:DNA protecting protein DprA